jgi:uncharacterized protein (TIGR02145 family)
MRVIVQIVRRAAAGSVALGIALGCVNAKFDRPWTRGQSDFAVTYFPARMADGKLWTTRNLNINTAASYCYETAEKNCNQYGRLYTWESAQSVCQLLGDGWRLPTDDDWREMAKHYGGVSADAADGGKAAYKALMAGGSSGFNAALGGGRSADGQYARLEAHGFYWTATEIDAANGWFYNFAGGGKAFHRQDGGEKRSAFSVRCVRE